MATAILGLLFLTVLLLSSVRVVRETERLVPFRLGRLMPARGPGLVLIVPIIDRPIRVDVPLRFLRPREGVPPGRGGALTPPRDELEGHPGLSVGEVAARAALLAGQRNPRTRRATAEDFFEALEALEGEKRRGFG